MRLPLDLRAVLNFLEKDEDVDMRLNTEFAIPSGEPLEISSGEIVERPVYRRQDSDNAKDLITGYDRLQLGLKVQLRPYFSDGTWFLRFNVEDANMASGTEHRLTFNGAYEFGASSSVQLVSLQRVSDVQTEKRVPGLHRLPAIGRVFKSRSVTREDRSLLIFLELVDE